MGNSYYKIWRNGEQIEAGYGVEATCDKADCGNKIDRGLAYLCGQTPGGDEHGCGGYFCGEHLLGDQKCKPCAEEAAEHHTVDGIRYLCHRDDHYCRAAPPLPEEGTPPDPA